MGWNSQNAECRKSNAKISKLHKIVARGDSHAATLQGINSRVHHFIGRSRFLDHGSFTETYLKELGLDVCIAVINSE